MLFWNTVRALVACVLIAGSATASNESNSHPFSALNQQARSVAYWTVVVGVPTITAVIYYAFAKISIQQEKMQRASDQFEQRMKDECESCLKEGGTPHHCCGYFM